MIYIFHMFVYFERHILHTVYSEFTWGDSVQRSQKVLNPTCSIWIHNKKIRFVLCTLHISYSCLTSFFRRLSDALVVHCPTALYAKALSAEARGKALDGMFQLSVFRKNGSVVTDRTEREGRLGGGAGPWCGDDKQPSVTVASPPRRPAPVSSHSEPAGTPPAWLYITSPWLLLLLLFGDLLRGQTSLPTPQTAVVKLPGGCVHSEQCSSARFAFYARTAQTHGHAETWVGCCVWGVVCEVLCVPYRFLISRF